MTSVWSHRPQFMHLGLFVAAYVLAAGYAQLLAIVPGTGISIWPPSGLFIATLVLAPRHSWPWWILGALLAELFSNVLWFHNPLPVALLIYTGNALEAMTGAWLVNRICGQRVRLETLREVLALVLLGAGIAPIVSATVGSATLAWFGLQSFATAWPLWWIGDATGVLIVAPLALVVLQNWRGEAQFSAARLIEAGVLGLIFLGVAALSLSGYLPFAYIIMPPLLWAAVRFEFKGAAVILILLALITAVFTISGASQFVGDPESQKHKQIMLHLFLAISAFSALIVAAISRQHHLAMLTLRRSVEALRERERELSQLVDMVPSHVWRLRPDGEPIFFNKRMVDFIGLEASDMDKPGVSRLEALIETVIHPGDAAAFRGVLSRCLVTGDSFAMLYRLRRTDGVYHWMSSRAEPLRDQDGRIVQWYGICHDIDDQIRAEQSLRDRERELSLLVDMVPVNIARMAPDGEPTFFSRRTAQSIGLDDVAAWDKPGISRLAAILGSTVHPEDAPRMREVLSHALITGEPYTIKYRRRRADGVYRWMEGRAEPLRDQSGAIVQWYTAALDIDDEVRALEALRDREREFSQLVDMVPSLLWRLSPQGEPVFFSKRMIEFFGLDIGDYDRPGMSGLAAAIAALAHPDDAARLADALNHSFATGESFSLNYRLRRADGVYRWMSGRGEPLRDESGNVLQWYGLCHDIDDQLRAEEALRESEKQLRRLVDALPTQIWAATAEGEPSYLNRRLAEYVGLTLNDLDVPDANRLQAAIQSSVHPDDAASVGRALAHSFTTGDTFTMKYRQRRADGVYRWINGRAEPLRNPDGRIVQWYGVSFDVDDEVRTQEELRRTQERLASSSQAASLAELSASIAHEVNQPLAAVVANSHACQRWLTSDPPNLERAQKTVERIIRDANSAAEVVSRIRALFKRSSETRSCATLSSVIAEARGLMADEAARRRVSINAEVEGDLPVLTFDRVQIQQVLVNLLRNGMDAMDSVATDKALSMRVRRKGDVVQTEISDRGPGIEHSERIFEPFFTTKGDGMGMGLAISRSIVESHGGRLWAEENEPRGATFIFTLPVEVKAAQ